MLLALSRKYRTHERKTESTTTTTISAAQRTTIDPIVIIDKFFVLCIHSPYYIFRIVFLAVRVSFNLNWHPVLSMSYILQTRSSTSVVGVVIFSSCSGTCCFHFTLAIALLLTFYSLCLESMGNSCYAFA